VGLQQVQKMTMKDTAAAADNNYEYVNTWVIKTHSTTSQSSHLPPASAPGEKKRSPAPDDAPPTTATPCMHTGHVKICQAGREGQSLHIAVPQLQR
jgi:hypothetical protein